MTAAARLFRHYAGDPAAADPPGDFAVLRLLEDGDRADLARLAAAVGEARLAALVERHGGRALSPRSRRFWELVLDRRAAAPTGLAAELWPL